MDKRWKAVIFDMDGTLFDTEPISRLAWLDIKEKYQLPVSEEFIHKLIGGTKETCQHVFDAYMPKGWPKEEVCAYHGKFMREYKKKHGVPVKGDLKDLLSYLKKEGYALAIATSSPKTALDFNLLDAKISDYFDVALSAQQVKRGKPYPDIYIRAMQLLNKQPEECIVIEDSYNGIRSAYAAKTSVVMIPDLLPPTEEIKALCDYCLEKLDDLKTIL